MRITKVIVEVERTYHDRLQRETCEHYVDTPDPAEAVREVDKILKQAGWKIISFKTRSCWLHSCK